MRFHMNWVGSILVLYLIRHFLAYHPLFIYKLKNQVFCSTAGVRVRCGRLVVRMSVFICRNEMCTLHEKNDCGCEYEWMNEWVTIELSKCLSANFLMSVMIGFVELSDRSKSVQIWYKICYRIIPFDRHWLNNPEILFGNDVVRISPNLTPPN